MGGGAGAGGRGEVSWGRGRRLASSSGRRAESAEMSRAREPCGSRSTRRSTPPSPANCTATSRLRVALLKPLQCTLRPRW